MTFPFPIMGNQECTPVSTLIDRTAGSISGDMTGGAGLTAAFDGTTSQTGAQGARKASLTGSAYIGKDWGSGVVHNLTGWKIWGSTNEAYTSHLTPTITVKLYGSNSGIESSGVELDSQTFADSATGPAAKSYLSGVTAGDYRYHWIKFTGAGHEWRIAELQFFEDVC